MLDKNLNLVKELDNGLHLHHTLISYAAYKSNYKLINQVATALIQQRLAMQATTISAFVLNDVAGYDMDLTRLLPRDVNSISDDSDINKNQLEKDIAFIGEIKRLTNIITSKSGNWEHIPLTDALKENIIDEEQYDEVMSAVIFFTVANYVRQTLEKMGISPIQLLRAYDWQPSLLGCVDYLQSLPKLTQAAITEKAKA